MLSWHCLIVTCVCRANIKVSSTETGAIFGNIVYESSAYADRSVVVLNDIHIDIMDYISPASCPDVQFRSMWAEFEWENKVGACNMLLSIQHKVLLAGIDAKHRQEAIEKQRYAQVEMVTVCWTSHINKEVKRV